MINEEQTYNDYPAEAKKNAQLAIDWKEKYGRDEVDAGTAVGWARAHQLAKGENLSVDTIKRMASFNRHRKNSSIKPELKDTPWKDKGYVSWLIWGGDAGVDWAMAKSKELDDLKETRTFEHIMTLNEFILNESDRSWNDKRRGPHPYDRGLTKKEKEEKEQQMKDQSKLKDDDSDAYKEMPGDKEARKKGEVKTSKHVKSYHELYGDEKNESIVNEDDNLEMLKLMNKAMKTMPGSAKQKAIIKDLNALRSKNGLEPLKESFLNEEKAEGDRGPIDDEKVEKALKTKSKETGVPLEFLRLVMRRGMAAWRTGHRPGAGVHQWGYARVNSFLTKQPGTWGGADSDIAKEVRDGGHDKELKKA